MSVRLMIGGRVDGTWIQVPDGTHYLSVYESDLHSIDAFAPCWDYAFKTVTYRECRVVVPGFKVTIPVLAHPDMDDDDFERHFGWAREQQWCGERCTVRALWMRGAWR